LALAAAAMFLLCCFRVGACREEVEEHAGDVSPIASTDSLLLAQDGCRVCAFAGLALLPGWHCCRVGACREEVEEHVGDVSPIASTDSLLSAQDGCRVLYALSPNF
jgi:hypothetical protein